MAKIVCVANPVRGVGRTSSAVNLAASLSLLEKKVLIVDCDPFKVTSSCFGFTHDNYDYGIDDLLTGFVGGKGVVEQSSLEYLDVIPAGHGLDEIEDNLAYNPDKEKILNIIIEKFREDYDYIIFDTPGDEGLLTKSAILASDDLLIPLKCDSHATGTFQKLLDMINDARDNYKSNIKMGGILFTFWDNSYDVDNMLPEDISDEFKTHIFETTVPVSKFYESDAGKTAPACLVDLKSDIADSFLNIAYEFLSRDV